MKKEFQVNDVLFFIIAVTGCTAAMYIAIVFGLYCA